MKYLIIIGVLLLAGCSQIGKARDIAEKVRYRAAFESVDYICNLAAVGAVSEMFDTPEKREAYTVICRSKKRTLPR